MNPDKAPATETLYLNEWPLVSFDPSIEGVNPIEPTGTAVPTDKVKDVRAAARDAGISLSVNQPSHA
ncbi:MAG: hypothetical protein AVDCRST_MAG93-5393 [uncultured Chloroflexia bacterium]|uniref:Uncharacterized protein n=1 Tax=uncultured Chloroflexia bacterium TaxID=1672391 RepID=A0A6J4KRX8_9CHLR|nr:MAG: hypothetical protein AVDCRST_MAG93-5393 [uncultured Chloroflexia bacterium]